MWGSEMRIDVSSPVVIIVIVGVSLTLSTPRSCSDFQVVVVVSPDSKPAQNLICIILNTGIHLWVLALVVFLGVLWLLVRQAGRAGNGSDAWSLVCKIGSFPRFPP